MEKKKVPLKYIKLIKDMNIRVITSVRTRGGVISEFLITIGLHQWSTLSSYPFALVMDDFTKSIQEEVQWCDFCIRYSFGGWK